jgi:two-component system, cell cycle sensor histidine kinase and response regulator CckA
LNTDDYSLKQTGNNKMTGHQEETRTKILIVEDEALIALDLRSLLEQMGYTVLAIVHSGEKALALIEQDPPDLVLMDIVLKGKMDGIEAADMVRSRWGIPVVFSTAYADRERLNRAKLVYPFGYLIKPFQENDIRVAVEMALYISKVDRERIKAEETLRQSEEYFKTITENSFDIILIVDKRGTITYASPSIERFLGYRPDTLIGKSTLDLIVSDDKPRAIEDFGRALLTKEVPIPNVFRIRHKNGSERILEGVGKNLVDNPVVAGFLMNVRDVTEHRRSQAALKANEEKYRLIIENSRDLIYTLSPEGKFLFLSPAVTPLLGYDAAALVGRPFQTIIHPDDVSACEEGLKQVLEMNGRTSGFRYRVRHASGEWRWHSSNVNAVPDELGNLLHFGAVARDLTDQLKLEEQLHQSQRMETVGRLAGGVAHDFNNLLTTILGNAEMTLMDMDRNDPFYGAMKEIKEAGDRAAGLTGQLLAFSRKQVFHPKVTDLNVVVLEISQILRRLIGEDIELQTILSPILGLVEADVGQLGQVIMNLAVNARDAMPDGGKLTIETANIELGERYAAHHVSVIPGPYVVLSISDNGIGMFPEVQARIFDPFFTTKERGKGDWAGSFHGLRHC